jgi:class 3 adenylate cyclase
MESAAITPSEDDLRPEMAHVLFADVVGYSRVTTAEQPRIQSQLWQAARASAEFTRAKAADQLVCLPTGDGVALVFTGSNVSGPMLAAQEISVSIRERGTFALRIGLHSGPVYWVSDINGSKGAAGSGINLAQRVMDCGDAGHILVSEVHAAFLREFPAWKDKLEDLGETEVKHGARLRLFNYSDGIVGNGSAPTKLARSDSNNSASGQARSLKGKRVALIYKRHAKPDQELLDSLERELVRLHCSVFIDRHLQVGLDWAREIERELRAADAVIPLISEAGAASEMLAIELEIAAEAAESQAGRPCLLPIRVAWEAPLPPTLGSILNPIQYLLWRGSEDTPDIVAQLTQALIAPPKAPARTLRQLEPPGGAMSLDSAYYVERVGDREVHHALARRDSIVLLEGARQMGKTSLLARGLQQARKSGAKVACTDFQKFNHSDLESLESFYLSLGTALANQLDLDKYPEDIWRSKSGPNENFERYLRREVLGSISGPVVWGIDEADRLFTCSFGSEVFGLFRSWHNARALDPESPWHRFTQVISYATEAHLFITDINQSPFNVGTRVGLQDFAEQEVRKLNTLYGEPLTSEAEVVRFHRLVGGQPYLTRRGLHELVTRLLRLEQLEARAIDEDGPFADHLKRFLVLLSRDAPLLKAVRDIIVAHSSPEPKQFQRLRAAGLLRGSSAGEARFRCELYESYLQRHLCA